MESGRVAAGPARTLLLGIIAVLLQQVAIPYEFAIGGRHSGEASLAHLHTGFLLAVAMLERDRRVVAGCFACVGAGWLVRAWLLDYGSGLMLVGMLHLLAAFGWTLLCVRWLGWPGTGQRQAFMPQDVLKFAGIGLLLFPLGYAVLDFLGHAVSGYDGTDIVASLIQVYFAKLFGVAVVTLPLVVGWTERREPAIVDRPGSKWLLLFVALLGLSLWVSRMVHARIGNDSQTVVMDYRLVLVAFVGWCMLNLRMGVAMVLFAIALFLMVHGLAGTARQSGTFVGVANLAHLGVEVTILLVGVLYYSLSARDRRRLEKRVIEDAQRDSITGLPNYNALLGQRDARQGAGGQVGYLLLDQAEALAVGYGLQAQAAAMGAVAARLARFMRPYYLGTGQFALLPNHGSATRSEWGALLSTVEHMEHRVDGRGIRMTPYLGVAVFRHGGGDIEHALINASNLAHEARRRNEVGPLLADASHSTLRSEEQRRLHDAADVMASLRGGRLVLYFQSICAMDRQAPGGMLRGEVLCRLLGDDGTVIPPARFVDTIEASRRGPELDLAVVEALFRELDAHPGALARIECVSVNLTGQSLSSAGFRERLEALLSRSPVALSCLCFEITETAAISNTDTAVLLLKTLREKGCHVAIDDFGTGMQSFARLRDMPFDVIKIDGSFVRNMLKEKRDFEVVQASVAVAKAWNAEVVAEFVEDEAVAARLRGMGVRWAQGFLYSRPEPLPDVLAAASVPR